MAVYAQPSGTTIDHIRAVVLTPELGDPAAYRLFVPVIPADGMPAYGAILDARYDDGGATTWERPAASG
ncbi:MAG: hypothetical protein U0871_10895 [Gemmataceae bacterium]